MNFSLHFVLCLVDEIDQHRCLDPQPFGMPLVAKSSAAFRRREYSFLVGAFCASPTK